MKHILLGAIFFFNMMLNVLSQDFITRGKIEFEVKVNNKRLSTENMEEGDPDLSLGLPDYNISYRELLFINNKWIYTQGRAGNLSAYELNENSLYGEIYSRVVITKKRYADEEYLILSDSLPELKWRIENETRKIAGWECRKAIARIYDSVYVVAFYCPEIIPQAGPEFFTGLPGMILGLAIPRYYTTWFATRVELANIDESKISPPAVKKGKVYGRKELAELLFKKYKETGWWEGITLEKVVEQLRQYVL